MGSRYLADALGKELGVAVIVENVTGSGSWIAWNRLLHNSELDGNTFAFVNHNVVFGEYDDVNPREDGLDDFELLLGQVVEYTNLLIIPMRRGLRTLLPLSRMRRKTKFLRPPRAPGLPTETLLWPRL